MSTEAIKIEATARTLDGKGGAGQLRRDGILPGIVYGSGKEGEKVQVDMHAFQMMLRKHSSASLLVDISVDGGAARKALVKEIQTNPLTRQPLHVDFQAIDMKKKFKVELPIECAGTPAGVFSGAGNSEVLIRSVEVECLPSDILESWSVDVSAMDVGDHISVGALGLDESKYTVHTAPEIMVANVGVSRLARKAAGAEEDGEEGAEGAEGAETEEGAGEEA